MARMQVSQGVTGNKHPGTVGIQGVDGRWVTLRTDKGDLEVTAKLGPKPPVVTAGGGVESVPRKLRRALTIWQGTDAPRMTLELALDKLATRGSVEPECRDIEQMAGALVKGDTPPPPLIVKGVAVPHDYGEASQNRWIISEPPDWGDEGDAIRRGPDGERMTQLVSLTLLLYTVPDHLERVEPMQPKPKYRVATAKQGDDFERIAQRELHNARLGGDLARLNRSFDSRFKHANAHTKVPAGAKVRLPSSHLQADWERALRTGRG